MGMIIMNGKEYTSSPKDGFPPIIYSDEEREVSVWRDGKPLYSIVISGTASANFDITTGVIPTIDNLVMSHIHVKSNGGTQINNYFMSSSDYARVRMDINPNTLHVDFGSSYPAKPLNYDLMLLYTKTTDVPGSGKYTTYGGLAHHYSTTEQVVGTWIDGKSIYEKTVNIGNLSVDSNWHTVPHGVTNIERVISFKGATYHSENGGFWVAYDLNSYRPTTSTGIVISVTFENIEYMNNWVGNHSAYITFQYTKTTD